MATVAVDFTHFDRTYTAGDQVADDDPLVSGAPHLFVGNPETLEQSPKSRKR